MTVREQVRELSSNGWQVCLLPRGAYETTHTPNSHTIGFSFDAQSGTHAIGSDVKKSFHALPNRLAFVPKGCDVFSESNLGGEYLTFQRLEDSSSTLIPAQPFSNCLDKATIIDAHRLRKILLKGGDIEWLECEQILLNIYNFASSVSVIHSKPRRKKWLDEKCMQVIDELIDAGLSTKLSINDIATQLGVSDAYFSRVFTQTIGTSPHAYIVGKRILRVRELINNTNHGLSSIALSTGFSSHSHMSAQFHAVLGVTPSEFRTQS